MKITGIMNLTDILLPRSLTAIPLLQNLTVRPARWMDAPNTDRTTTTVMNITDTLARPARWTDAPNTGGTLTMVVNITDTAVRPARWTDAPNTGGTLTTVMSTADTTINTVIATVPAKRLSARTGLTAGTTVDGIIGSKTTDDKKQLLRISQQLLFVC
ncbi:MAG: hypothetical protein HDR21_14670 [Lachnospiraceae bacterium]|nr:hypothetical protein [Lachnospiraceae bacterium]